MVAPVVTGEAEKEAARRYAAGESIYGIAKDYGCRTDPVRRAILRQGVKLRRPRTLPKLRPEHIDEAVRMYEDTDLSVSEVARRSGITPSSMSGLLVRRGVPIRSNSARAEQHGNWKGGRHTDGRSGYVKLRLQPSDPLYQMTSLGNVLEHRYVMACKLGRPLESNETVHHINGDKADNRPENLELRRKRHGNGVRLVCACCGSTDIKEVTLEYPSIRTFV